jgi:hypothetical protein
VTVPCPFCGSANVIPSLGYNEPGFYLLCVPCNARGPRVNSLTAATEAWISRESTRLHTAEREDLRTHLSMQTTARDEAEAQLQAKTEEAERLQHAIDGVMSVNADEVRRLRGWLEHIGGRGRPQGHGTMAAAALRGELVPEVFEE